VTATIDAKLLSHREVIAANFENMRATMIAEALESSKIVVNIEMGNLERKFTAMMDSSSSTHSNLSQQLLSSGCSTASQNSLGSSVSSEHLQSCSGSMGGATAWVCPFCLTPLKHEKSFHDHMALLLTRVHEIPTVKITKKGVSKVDNRCLFNIDNPSHRQLVEPWKKEGLTFWNQARYFMDALMSRLHPGIMPQAISESNPNYDPVFKFIQDCRSGAFVPECL
jgi:hypothetical protein